MSKLGKKPITIPKDAKVKLENGKLILTGPKGSRELSLNDKIFSTTISEDNNLILKLIEKNESLNVIWGTTRSIINSALIGVTAGHEKILELTGVGLRAILKGSILNLQLGFSHDISYKIPEGAQLSVEKSTIIKISGIDKELVGKVAAEIKMLKPIEPYKGKGIKERGQYVLRKEKKVKRNKMANVNYNKRAQRIRRKLKQVNSERFRLTVFKSSRNISAQIIDDKSNKTLISESSIKEKNTNKKKTDLSLLVAERLSRKAMEKKITRVYFDRGGYKYHGRIKIFAEALRKGGLIF